MTGQNNASENGIYEVESINGYYANVVRAEDYDSAEEINAGDFVFVQAGANAGQGYVLGELSESFEVGVDAINFSRFTIDTTEPVSFARGIYVNDTTMLGNPTEFVEPGTTLLVGGDTMLEGRLTVSSGTADFGSASSVRVPTPIAGNEAATKEYVDNARAAAITTETVDRLSLIHI